MSFVLVCSCSNVNQNVSNVACRVVPCAPFKVFGDLDRVGLGGNLDVLAVKAECCYEEVRHMFRGHFVGMS